jgi:hypothetical protein
LKNIKKGGDKVGGRRNLVKCDDKGVGMGKGGKGKK